MPNSSKGKLTLLCEPSEKGRCLLQSGRAELVLERESGKVLPVLREKDTKKWIEILKGSPAKVQRLAQITSLVVSVAHVVSGMDVVVKLDAIAKKLDELLEGRRIDQLASVYEIARSTRAMA